MHTRAVSAFADKPELQLDTAESWDAWLDVHEADPEGVRLRLRKKATLLPGMLYAEALDVALCHGWIDGQSKGFDADYFHQLFTPRRPRSPWSQLNRSHGERLIAEGRMRPRGLAEIEQAKADGRWDAAYRQKDADIPPELAAALATSAAASEAFATLDGRNRFAFIFRVQTAKQSATRERKAADFVAMLERGERIYP